MKTKKTRIHFTCFAVINRRRIIVKAISNGDSRVSVQKSSINEVKQQGNAFFFSPENDFPM